MRDELQFAGDGTGTNLDLNCCIWTPPALAEAILTDAATGILRQWDHLNEAAKHATPERLEGSRLLHSMRHPTGYRDFAQGKGSVGLWS